MTFIGALLVATDDIGGSPDQTSYAVAGNLRAGLEYRESGRR